MQITYGEDTARCDFRTTFRDSLESVLPKARYDNKVRDLALNRLLKDGMSIERTNRLFRLLEKVRYKGRRRRPLVRFVVVKLDAVWSAWSPPRSAEFRFEGWEAGCKL